MLQREEPDQLIFLEDCFGGAIAGVVTVVVGGSGAVEVGGGCVVAVVGIGGAVDEVRARCFKTFFCLLSFCCGKITNLSIKSSSLKFLTSMLVLHLTN